MCNSRAPPISPRFRLWNADKGDLQLLKSLQDTAGWASGPSVAAVYAAAAHIRHKFSLYSEMDHLLAQKFPLLTEENVENSPSRRDGITAAMEARRRRLAANHIFHAAATFNMCVRVLKTAAQLVAGR